MSDSNIREYKFRAWIYREKVMCDVERLYLPMNTLTIGASNESRTIGLNHENFEKDIELMQWSGAKDKNDKDIYDGDIMYCNNNKEIIGIIRYGEYRNPFSEDRNGGHMGFYVDWQSDLEAELLRKDLVYWAKNSCISGNIYENPELLEG